MDCHEFPSHLHDIVYYLQEHINMYHAVSITS